jgi:DNA primase
VKLSAGQRASLTATAQRYHQALDQSALTYLAERGLADQEVVEAFCLGVVRDPAPGHEDYVGRLCLPYLTPSGVVALRFRCLRSHDHSAERCPKYLDLPEQEARLFNVKALREASDVIYVTEGELDAISATVVGFPAVGVSGATKWQPHWSRNLEDFEEVVVLADGDDPGRNFAKMVRQKVERVRVVQMPAGSDVNDFLVTKGVDAFKSLIS